MKTPLAEAPLTIHFLKVKTFGQLFIGLLALATSVNQVTKIGPEVSGLSRKECLWGDMPT